jgi:hypothetical protein
MSASVRAGLQTCKRSRGLRTSCSSAHRPACAEVRGGAGMSACADSLASPSTKVSGWSFRLESLHAHHRQLAHAMAQEIANHDEKITTTAFMAAGSPTAVRSSVKRRTQSPKRSVIAKSARMFALRFDLVMHGSGERVVAPQEQARSFPACQVQRRWICVARRIGLGR